jgi:hypothetical protein
MAAFIRFPVLAVLIATLCALGSANAGAGDASGILIPSDQVVVEWSARGALAKRLASVGYSGAEAKLAEIGDDHVQPIRLDDFLKFKDAGYIAWRKPKAAQDDTLRLDTLGFGALVLRGDALFLLARESAWTGYWVPEPEPISRIIADILPLPILRLGLGTPGWISAQAGIAIGTGGKDGRLGPYGAFEAGITGYGWLAGITMLYHGDRHMIPVFVTMGGAFHRDWSHREPWKAGPLIQLGMVNFGLQGTVWIHPEMGGSVSALFQLLPMKFI